MSTMTAHPVADTVTMVKRNTLRSVRYPLIGFVIGVPVVLLVLFTYVFGGAMGAGMGGDSKDYLTFLVPGILLMTIASAAQMTAISVSQDITSGIVSRLRTMSIGRGSILNAHVVVNTIMQVIGLVVVFLVALLMGFRTSASVWQLLGCLGVLVLITLSINWLGVAMGAQAKTVESASNTPMVLMLGPFLSTAFVPLSSMPGWLQPIAEWQPFTPFTETVRSLLDGEAPGSDLWVTLGWCVVLCTIGYVWARAVYERKSLAAG